MPIYPPSHIGRAISKVYPGITPFWVTDARKALIDQTEAETEGLREQTRQQGLTMGQARQMLPGQEARQERLVGLRERAGQEEVATSQQERQISGVEAAHEQSLQGIEYKDKESELKLKEIKLEVEKRQAAFGKRLAQVLENKTRAEANRDVKKAMSEMQDLDMKATYEAMANLGDLAAGEVLGVTRWAGGANERLILQQDEQDPDIKHVFEIDEQGGQRPARGLEGPISMSKFKERYGTKVGGKWKNLGSQGIYNEELGPASFVTMERLGVTNKADQEQVVAIYKAMVAANAKQYQTQQKPREQVVAEAVASFKQLKGGYGGGLEGGSYVGLGEAESPAQEYKTYLMERNKGKGFTEEQFDEFVRKDFPDWNP